MTSDDKDTKQQDQADVRETEACESAECEPGDTRQAAGSKRAGGKKTTTPAPKPTPTAPTSERTFTYPFNVRYAAECLDLTGFTDGYAYTESQIRDILIANGYTEFADVEPAFHRSEATNTLVITIKGSKKGSGDDQD